MTMYQITASPIIITGLPEGSVPSCLHVSGQILDHLFKLPASERAQALEPLLKSAAALETIAHKAHMPMPRLYVYGNTDEPHMAWSDWLTQHNEHQKHEKVPMVGMNIHLLCDGSTLTCDPPWRPILRLTPEESYAVMAHEVGHLFHGHVKVPKMRHPTQDVPGRAHNHNAEFEADDTAIQLGAEPDAMMRAALKIQRWNREHIFRRTLESYTTFPASEATKRDECWQRGMTLRSKVTANNMQGSYTHPSLRDRLEQMRASLKEQDESWQERLTAASEDTSKPTCSR